MKFSILLLIGIAILTLINISVAQPVITHDLLDNDHYIIVGHVYPPYSDDGIVILINTKTGESLEVIARDCEEYGMNEYLFNLANLHQGWTYDDEFIISYGNSTTQFNILKDSIKYQQDIQRPDDVDPIYIFTGLIIVVVGSGYFYMKKKKPNQEVTTLEEEQVEIRSLVDKIFGGTKKAILLLMTAAIVGSMLMDKPVPPELMDMAIYLYMIYFGAGSVKLGMNLKYK